MFWLQILTQLCSTGLDSSIYGPLAATFTLSCHWSFLAPNCPVGSANAYFRARRATVVWADKRGSSALCPNSFKQHNVKNSLSILPNWPLKGWALLFNFFSGLSTTARFLSCVCMSHVRVRPFKLLIWCTWKKGDRTRAHLDWIEALFNVWPSW